MNCIPLKKSKLQVWVISHAKFQKDVCKGWLWGGKGKGWWQEKGGERSVIGSEKSRGKRGEGEGETGEGEGVCGWFKGWF